MTGVVAVAKQTYRFHFVLVIVQNADMAETDDRAEICSVFLGFHIIFLNDGKRGFVAAADCVNLVPLQCRMEEQLAVCIGRNSKVAGISNKL